MAAPMSAKDWQSVTALLEQVAAEPDRNRRQRQASQANMIMEQLEMKANHPITAAVCRQVTKKQVGWCGEAADSAVPAHADA